MVKDYMRGVVENGSGKKANLEGYEVGGKTGTAEKLPRDNGKYLVSFIGYVHRRIRKWSAWWLSMESMIAISTEP